MLWESEQNEGKRGKVRENRPAEETRGDSCYNGARKTVEHYSRQLDIPAGGSGVRGLITGRGRKPLISRAVNARSAMG